MMATKRRAKREQVVRLRSMVAEVGSLYHLGLTICQRLMDHYTLICSDWRMMEAAETALDGLGRSWPILQKWADFLNSALGITSAAVQIIEMTDAGILSEEEAYNLLERVKQGDISLNEVLDIVRSNRMVKEGSNGE